MLLTFSDGLLRFVIDKFYDYTKVKGLGVEMSAEFMVYWNNEMN